MAARAAVSERGPVNHHTIVEIIKSVPRMASVAQELRVRPAKIGLVPTMGAFHQGHLSLIDRARSMCGVVVVSVFVNPLQFRPEEDYERYPRDLAQDSEMAFNRGVDYIFSPSPEEMLPEDFRTFVTTTDLSDKIEGASRPGHFRGVTTVVSKLFNIVRPHFAYFGRKDAQQAIVIRRMVTDLSVGAEIVVCPIVREEDGLALSSRNQYLNANERRAAPVIRRALERCRALYNGGERSTARLIQAARSLLEAEPLVRIDYVTIADIDSLDHLVAIPPDKPALVAAAVFIGTTRLIDNIVLNGTI